MKTMSFFRLKIGYGRDKKTEIILKLENLSEEQCKKTSHCSNIHLDTKSECTSSCGIGCVKYKLFIFFFLKEKKIEYAIHFVLIYFYSIIIITVFNLCPSFFKVHTFY